MQVNESSSIKSNWTTLSPRCQKELVAKKITLFAVAVINIIAVTSVLYFFSSYLPIPTTALLVASPCIAGVVGALVYLKLPTFGVNEFNYVSYSNPIYIFSKALGMMVFGPIILAVRWLDLYNYSDPYKADAFVSDIKKDNFENNEKKSLHFEYIMKNWGPRLHNLSRFGLLPGNHLSGFSKIYKESIVLIKEKEFVIQEGSTKNLALIQEDLNKLEIQWNIFKDQLIPDLPNIETPRINPAQKTSFIKLWLRDLTGISVFTS